MESIVMDQSAARPRTGGFSGLAIDGGSRGYGGLSRARSSSSAFHSLPSLDYLVSERTGINGNFGSFGPRPPPPLPVYSSLPPSFSSPIAYASPPPPQRPSFGPLLPLPPLGATISPPGKVKATSSTNSNSYVSNGRSRDKRKNITKATAGRRKEVQPSSNGTPIAGLKKLVVETPSASSPEEDTAEDSVYSLSPPPSSLPLPSFALVLRARTAAATAAAAGICTGEAMVDGAGAAPAADDLHRLLCL